MPLRHIRRTLRGIRIDLDDVEPQALADEVGLHADVPRIPVRVVQGGEGMMMIKRHSRKRTRGDDSDDKTTAA